VAGAAGDVRGQRLGDQAGVFAVAGDQVGDVVADHPAEPAALLPGVVEVVADVGGGRDADGDGVRVPSGVGRRVPYRLDHPLGEEGVGELEDEAVGLLPG